MRSTILFFLFISFSLTLFAQEKGKASYYADMFEGRKTASGEIYQHQLKTAAHKTLPFGTKVKVTNLSNNKSVEVKINDRGPFVQGRIIDLSKSAASAIDGVLPGIIEVEITILSQKKSKVILLPFKKIHFLVNDL